MPAKLQSCHFRKENQILLCFLVRPTNYTLKQNVVDGCQMKRKKEKSWKSWWGKAQRACVPAVHNNGSSFWGIEKLHLTNEAEEARGIARNPMVWPAGEVELTNLSDLMVAFLRRQHSLYFSSIRLQSACSDHCSCPSCRGLNKRHFALRDISSWTPSTNEAGNTQLRTMKVNASSQFKPVVLRVQTQLIRNFTGWLQPQHTMAAFIQPPLALLP